MSSVTFKAAFPPNCKPLRGGDGEAWRLWLDCYLDSMNLAKLDALGSAKVALTVTIETDNG